MTFAAIIPFSGLLGWQFLEKTTSNQKESLSISIQYGREEESFRESISRIDTAEELVNNREILRVALGAFGLESEINNKFLIRKILEEGALDPQSLANRFSDKRYLALTKAFGFGDFDGPRTKLSNFPDEILSAYLDRSFEVSVGEQDTDLRLALSLEREMRKISKSASSENSKWYAVLGNLPVKEVFERALRFPTGFGNLDIDRQVEVIKEQIESRFGVAEFDSLLEPKKLEDLRRNFLLNAQLLSTQNVSGGSIALRLLQSGATLRL